MATNVYDSKHVIDFGSGPCDYYGFYVSTSSTSYHAENSKWEDIENLIFRIGKLKPDSRRCDVHYIAGLAYCLHHTEHESESDALQELLEEEVSDSDMVDKILEITREIGQ